MIAGIDLYRWWGADGPILSILTTLPALLLGLSYTTIKIVTCLLGCVGSYCVWELTYTLFRQQRLALIACAVSLFSFWNLTQSVSAKPHMVSAVFGIVMVTVLARRTQRSSLCAGMIGALGMYSQVSFWANPLILIIQPLAMMTFLISSIPFMYFIVINRLEFVGPKSYVGSKLVSDPAVHAIYIRLGKTVSQFTTQILALIYSGDSVFRQNIPFRPYLDPVSIGFFMLGVIVVCCILIARVRSYLPNYLHKPKEIIVFVITPFVLAQLLAALDTESVGSVPNMGRSAGAMWYVSIVVAIGIYILSERLDKVSRYLLPILIAIIAVMNTYQFGYIYPRTLPDHNVPFSLVINTEVKKHPERSYRLAGCCWGQYGQPEPKAFQILDPDHGPIYMEEDGFIKTILCTSSFKPSQSTSYITRPGLYKSVADRHQCTMRRLRGQIQQVISQGVKVADIIEYE